MADEPTEKEIEEAARQLWLKVKPGKEAQKIRGEISTAIDDSRFPQWLLDYCPDYVWYLVDIAAQKGLEHKKEV